MEPSHTQGAPLWLTAYLFFEGHVYGETADRVIREVVAPLARACRRDAVRWFFLRYDEEASHVRLRFLASGPVLGRDDLAPRRRGRRLLLWPAAIISPTPSPTVRAVRGRPRRRPLEPGSQRFGGGAGFEVGGVADVSLARASKR
jgi:hypothetical protein